MADRLDELVEAAGPLLDRADSVLSVVGAAEGHRVWSELRRVRLLPGDAVRAVCDLRPDAVLESVPELRDYTRAYADLADALPVADTWSGEAAEAYEQARRRAAVHLNGGPDSLGHRMGATADLGDALAEWMRRTRGDLAMALAEVLGSAEAVTLSAGELPPDEEASAAAEVAALLLRTVADNYDRGEQLLDESAALQNALLV